MTSPTPSADVSPCFTPLFQDETCPSSTVWAKVKGCQDRNNEYLEGVTRQHLESLHDRFVIGKWTKTTDWKQRVQYTARAHFSDPCQEDVVLSYDASDPIDVKCERRKVIGSPFHLQCKTADDISMLIKVQRTKMVDCMPSDEKSRYKVVSIQNYRDFTRISSSFSHVSFQYRFVIEWSARSLRDAYAARPIYKIFLFAHIESTELTDSLLVGDASVPDFLHDSSKMEWLQNNFKAKISDMCLGFNLNVCATPSSFNIKKQQKRIRKSINESVPPIDDESPLMEEHEQADEDVECFDEGDDDHNEYM